MMSVMTDAELKTQAFKLLVKTFGDVNAERFIVLTNRNPQDYTRWREANMYIGESVHEVAERARGAAVRYRTQNVEKI